MIIKINFYYIKLNYIYYIFDVKFNYIYIIYFLLLVQDVKNILYIILYYIFDVNRCNIKLYILHSGFVH
jgi:hypothetical protein